SLQQEQHSPGSSPEGISPCRPTPRVTGSPPGPSTPGRTPTPRPARPSCRSTPPPPTRRPPPASTRATNTRAAATRRAPRWRPALARPTAGDRAPASPGGFAATPAVVAALLKPGDEVAAAADLYGGTYRLLERVFKPWGLVSRYTDDSRPEGFASI